MTGSGSGHFARSRCHHAVSQSHEDPLRLEADTVAVMDEAWRTRGSKTRMEFLLRALGHYLTHIGAADAAAKLGANAGA